MRTSRMATSYFSMVLLLGVAGCNGKGGSDGGAGNVDMRASMPPPPGLNVVLGAVILNDPDSGKTFQPRGAVIKAIDPGSMQPVAQATARLNGGFVLENLPDGTFNIEAKYGELIADPISITVPPDQEKLIIQINIPSEPYTPIGSTDGKTFAGLLEMGASQPTHITPYVYKNLGVACMPNPPSQCAQQSSVLWRLAWCPELCMCVSACLCVQPDPFSNGCLDWSDEWSRTGCKGPNPLGTCQ